MVHGFFRLSRRVGPEGSDHSHDAVHAGHLGRIGDSVARRCDYVCSAIVLYSGESQGVLLSQSESFSCSAVLCSTVLCSAVVLFC